MWTISEEPVEDNKPRRYGRRERCLHVWKAGDTETHERLDTILPLIVQLHAVFTHNIHVEYACGLSKSFAHAEKDKTKLTAGDSIVTSSTHNEVKLKLLFGCLDAGGSNLDDRRLVDIHDVHIGPVEQFVEAVLEGNTLASECMRLDGRRKLLL